ncbi:MAG: type II secretion system protein [Deltaproteobacteria bacterium]|nr:type II secretion system protein [Deltaproteobacteria bacterium]
MTSGAAGNKRGFSLLELIVVLALIGIVGLMAGFGIQQMVSGFIFTKSVSDNAGKGKLGLLRLSLEMRRIEKATSGTAHAITFNAVHYDVVTNKWGTKPYTISWDGAAGGSVLLNSDLLIAKVKNFTLQYYSVYNGAAATTWNSSSRLIGIALTLADTAQTDSTFTTRITPRNL